jgi:hypothetical protein
MRLGLPRLLLILISLVLAACAIAPLAGYNIPQVGPYVAKIGNNTVVLAVAYVLLLVATFMGRR